MLGGLRGEGVGVLTVSRWGGWVGVVGMISEGVVVCKS